MCPPTAYQGLTGPRWPVPARRSSPPPLMGKVLPCRLPSRLSPLLSPLLRSPPLRFVVCRGGVLNRSWGFPSISWFSPRTNGVLGCSWGGGPPSPSGWGPAPFPSPPPCTPCAWGACCLGVPLLVMLVRGMGSPCLCMPCARCERCSGDAPSPSSSLWLWGIPPFLLRHAMRRERTLPCGGPPLPLGLGYAPPATAICTLSNLPPAGVGCVGCSPSTGLACLELGAQAAACDLDPSTVQPSACWCGVFPLYWSGMP